MAGPGRSRRPELGALALAAAWHSQDGLHVLLRRSKGDHAGEGQAKALSFGKSPVICPACAVLRWAGTAARRGCRAPARRGRPLFRAVPG